MRVKNYLITIIGIIISAISINSKFCLKKDYYILINYVIKLLLL